jgi:predicted nucleotidyltransferase
VPATRDEAVAVLRAHRAALEARGVRHTALFGSIARGEARADSDIDVLIELDPARPLGVFAYVGIKNFIRGLFPARGLQLDALTNLDGARVFVAKASRARAAG